MELLNIYILLISNLIIPIIIYYLIIKYFKNKIAIAKVNKRSLHNNEIISAGGIIFSIQILFFISIFSIFSNYSELIISFLIILLIGYIDDRLDIKSYIKFILLFLLSAYFVIKVINLDTFQYEFYILNLSILKYSYLKLFFEIIFLFWFINLHNFMDGSDGNLTINSILIYSILLIYTFLKQNDDFTLQLLISISIIALIAFLFFNLPNAKIFMGDSGSLFLGLLTYFFCFYMINNSYFDILIFFMLNSIFIIDTTFTVLRRLINKENILIAHNKHFYQRYILSKQIFFNKYYDENKSRKKAHLSYLKKIITIFLFIITPLIVITEMKYLNEFFSFVICYIIVFIMIKNNKITF